MVFGKFSFLWIIKHKNPNFFIFIKMLYAHPVKQNLGGRFFEEVGGVLRILCIDSANPFVYIKENLS